MIICDYCDHYATKGYCDKCPYGGMLEANLRGEFPSQEWTKDGAIWELKQLDKMFGWDDPPYMKLSLQDIIEKLRAKK